MPRAACTWVIGLAALLAMPSSTFAVSAIAVHIGEISSPQGQARNLNLDYRLDSGKPQLKLKSQVKLPRDSEWSDADLSCETFEYAQAADFSRQWRCDKGSLISGRIKAPFALTFSLRNQQGARHLHTELALTEASMSDASGLHAAEKLAGKATLALQQEGKDSWDHFNWKASVDWVSGEAFWQPFYFASGGHGMQARGRYQSGYLSVDHAGLHLKDIGNMSFNGQFRLSDHGFQKLSIAAPNVNLAALYPLILKPLLERTLLNNLEMAGMAGLKLNMQNGEPVSFQLDLADADVHDKNGRFFLYKVNASIPWAYDAAKDIRLSYESGQLLRVPLGAADLSAKIDRYALTSQELRLPVLDGALNLSDVSAAWAARQWHWHLRASITPIDMPALSQALGWPRMEGKVSASIPMVTYSGGNLTTDGAMGFNLFDGNIAVNNLAMQDPMGVSPRFYADLQFRNLDLGDLTRTFSFGAIEGKLDGDVTGLELVKWQPVKFDARFYSSSGRYRKKISQRAVENISALGGAGAAAAIQRSFLRFFKEFNYQKIGLSCKLRYDMCEMNGIESTTDGYVIVKGSGIPAITVMGYNHEVSWNELLERLKRITGSGTKAVVK